eukprot:SAG31_NODE_2411_length_5752_cov_2.118167_7_plen_27_part_01
MIRSRALPLPAPPTHGYTFSISALHLA